MTHDDERFDKLLKAMVSGEPHNKAKQLREAAEPLNDADRPDDDENKPEP